MTLNYISFDKASHMAILNFKVWGSIILPCLGMDRGTRNTGVRGVMLPSLTSFQFTRRITTIHGQGTTEKTLEHRGEAET